MITSRSRRVDHAASNSPAQSIGETADFAVAATMDRDATFTPSADARR